MEESVTSPEMCKQTGSGIKPLRDAFDIFYVFLCCFLGCDIKKNCYHRCVSF